MEELNLLPSAHQLKEVVKVYFEPEKPITGTVTGIHFYLEKVKYDVSIWLPENDSTRIYNIDSAFVFKT